MALTIHTLSRLTKFKKHVDKECWTNLTFHNYSEHLNILMSATQKSNLIIILKIIIITI